MPSRKRKQDEVVDHTSEQQYRDMRRVAGETLKSFSRTHRYLRDVEIDIMVNKLTSQSRGFHAFAGTSVREFVDTLETMPMDRDVFMWLAGIDNDLVKHMIVVLNLYDATIDVNDKNQIAHFVVLLFNPQERKALIIDPLESIDGGCNDTVLAMIYSALDTKFEAFGISNYQIESICLGIQDDEHSCGIWAAEVVKHYIDNNGDLDSITIEAFSNVNIKTRRTYWSQQLYGR